MDSIFQIPHHSSHTAHTGFVSRPPLATSTPASTIILAIPTTSVAANHSVAPFASVTRFVGVPRSCH